MTNFNLFYFGLEPIKSRYTYQLCEEWMPSTFSKYKNINFVPIRGTFDPDEEIKVGAVLDAIGRGKYSLSQCQSFLELIRTNQVQDGDVLFFQDFWTPGIESIFYALDLYRYKNIRIYTMLHAQTVDEYDFTYPMKNWMRPYELGFDKKLSGIFVGSTIHKEQLRNAGFEAPIHVVSLPIHAQLTLDKLPEYNSLDKKKTIVFSSRLDKEKNPYFMLETAKGFLDRNPEYEWHITTSGKNIRSMLPNVIDDLYDYANIEPRFKILCGLSKEEYYTELATCAIQFNSSLQDYVSWTVIESTLFGADIVFPNFRSFPEFIPSSRLYKPFDIDDAVQTLEYAIRDHQKYPKIGYLSDLGRQMEGYIIAHNLDVEINIWHESEYCLRLLQNDKNSFNRN